MDEEVSEMINSKGELRCDKCGKKLAVNLEGRVEVVCPRCRHFNIFETDKGIDKKQELCLQ